MTRPVSDTRRKVDPSRARLVRAAGVSSVAVAVTLIVIKTLASAATGSVAILSSLADSVLDLIASVITLVAVRFALEPADREHRFGHGKLEALAGLAQAIVVTVSTAYVAWRAIGRLLAPQPIVEPVIGAAVMIASLALTVGLVSFQRLVVKRTGSLAIGADAVHYQADVLTNLGVLAAIALNAWLGWFIADPILGLVVVGVIFVSLRSVVVQAFNVLLDRELSAGARRTIQDIAMEHENVLGVHDLRTRSSGSTDFIQFHLELDPMLTLEDAHTITEEVEDAVKRRFPQAEVLIHADPYGITEARDAF